MKSAWVLAVIAAGCHVTRQSEIATPVASERTVHHAGAHPRPPALVLTDAGTLRFVEPLECPTEEVVTMAAATETEIAPNLATFVVGVIATSIGGVLTVRGLIGDSATDPLTLGGVVMLGAGLPLAIGPWIGNRIEKTPHPSSSALVRRPGPGVACGERGFAATSASLAIRGIEVHGAVADDGTYAISPYALVDAFQTKMLGGLDITATVHAASGTHTVHAVIDGGALISRAPQFLAHPDFDPSIAPMRVVPNLVAGTLRASLTQTSRGPALRIVLPIKNDGPGESYALRGLVTASHKAVDGRVLYIGKLAKGATVSRELLIPLAPAAAEALRNTQLEIAIELRDAHGTAPATPVRFRGAVLVDLPRG